MHEEGLFAEAIELPPGERGAFLQEACGDDEALRRSMESLLAAHEVEDAVLDEPTEELTALRRSMESLLAAHEVEDAVVDEPAEEVTMKRERSRGSEPGADSLEVPQAVGRYVTREVLGRGSYGLVLRCLDEQLDRDVAVKIPRRAQGQSKEVVDAFVHEAKQMARLRHPGIVTVHDVGVIDETCFIVSDFLEGEDLSRWLDSHQPSWLQAAEIAIKVVEALSYAHARATIHRDIKPSNIIVTAEAQPVLVDFGLALSPSTRATGKGMLMGSPIYMSPEQARGEGHRIDGRTDIYSLGVVLYEMLTGQRPFRADNVPEVIRMVIEDEPQPARQLVPDLPQELEAVCMKAMAKRIADRYTTAGDLAAALRLLIAEQAARTWSPKPAPPGRVGDVPEPPPDPKAGSGSQPVGRERTDSGPERRQITAPASISARILIVDDHAMFREGVRGILERRGFSVVGEAADGLEAIELIAELSPDVVVMDLNMPELDGIAATKRIMTTAPDTRIIALSMHGGRRSVEDMLEAGAAGYILKDSVPEQMVDGVRAVLRGETYLTPKISKHVVDGFLRDTEDEPGPLSELTTRQREILQLIAEGQSTKEIAGILDVSSKTVETHRMRLMDRLDIHDVPGLVRFAIRAGLVSSDE